MAQVIRVSDVQRALGPMFLSMLTADELASLTFRIVPVEAAADEPPCSPDAVVDMEAWVRWEILGERGGSGGFYVEDGFGVLIRRVQSDLQDVISESAFAWGQLRGPSDLLS